MKRTVLTPIPEKLYNLEIMRDTVRSLFAIDNLAHLIHQKIIRSNGRTNGNKVVEIVVEGKFPRITQDSIMTFWRGQRYRQNLHNYGDASCIDRSRALEGHIFTFEFSLGHAFYNMNKQHQVPLYFLEAEDEVNFEVVGKPYISKIESRTQTSIHSRPLILPTLDERDVIRNLEREHRRNSV